MGLRRDLKNAKAALAEFVKALGLPPDAKWDDIMRRCAKAKVDAIQIAKGDWQRRYDEADKAFDINNPSAPAPRTLAGRVSDVEAAFESGMITNAEAVAVLEMPLEPVDALNKRLEAIWTPERIAALASAPWGRDSDASPADDMARAIKAGGK